MHFHVLIVFGLWKFEDGRLFRYRQHTAVKNKAVRWMMWDRVL